MKNIASNIIWSAVMGCCLLLGSCEESLSEKLGKEADILISFKVTGTSGTVFNSSIEQDDIKIKVSPYLDAAEELKAATPKFYLSKGATVSPDPDEPQNFAQEGGVKYTVTSEDGSNTHVYTVTWTISDKLPYGSGFSYAEIGAKKSFAELGYPGTVGNFNLPSLQFGDLQMYHAYCGDYIVLLSRGYIAAGNSEYGIRVVDKTTLESTGTLNIGSIPMANIMMVTSDYVGHCVAAVVTDGKTELFYWNKPTDAPVSLGTVDVNLAPSTSDLSNNFQVAGDVTTKAWVTALAPRSAEGAHYRVQITNGQLASTYSTIKTGYSSSDCVGFQMISPLDDSDQPNYVVGDTEGKANAANSIHAYINTFSGSTLSVMPNFWQNTLQTWWVGTGFSTARTGGRAPVVSALPINGKTYCVVTSGSAWWHAAAVLSSDLQSLAHENLNIAASVNRAWCYGGWVDWYWNADKEEAYLSVWFGRLGLYTYKMTCFE